MAYLRRLSTLLALSLPIALAPGCTSNLSTTGQLIECDVGANGAISNCQPTTQTETDDPAKCVDVDEDGDDDPDDEADEADDASELLSPSEGDDDDDGTPDEADADDDNDGVPDVDDCDEEAGGDDDELDDDDSIDDDL